MSTQNPPHVVRSYLSQLETALDGVPSQARQAILDGAAEELAGLDAEAAAARIDELGDPEFIAAEARADSTAPQAAPQAAAPAAPAGRRTGDARWYIVVASLLVAFGGVVVPVLGWLFGFAMMWASKSWRLWEKWVATLTPPVAVVVAVLVVQGPIRAAIEGDAPLVGNPSGNPFGLASADLTLAYLFLLVGLNAVVGMWLLWRGLRRAQTRLA